MTTTLPLSRPAALGFDGERLARIDRFLAERYVEPGLLPCALLLVARKGELVHKCVLGHASLANGKRLEEDTIFRFYSMTKPVTTVTVLPPRPPTSRRMRATPSPTGIARAGDGAHRQDATVCRHVGHMRPASVE